MLVLVWLTEKDVQRTINVQLNQIITAHVFKYNDKIIFHYSNSYN